jgi:hypothetical protein
MPEQSEAEIERKGQRSHKGARPVTRLIAFLKRLRRDDADEE